MKRLSARLQAAEEDNARLRNDVLSHRRNSSLYFHRVSAHLKGLRKRTEYLVDQRALLEQELMKRQSYIQRLERELLRVVGDVTTVAKRGEADAPSAASPMAVSEHFAPQPSPLVSQQAHGPIAATQPLPPQQQQQQQQTSTHRSSTSRSSSADARKPSKVPYPRLGAGLLQSWTRGPYASGKSGGWPADDVDGLELAPTNPMELLADIQRLDDAILREISVVDGIAGAHMPVFAPDEDEDAMFRGLEDALVRVDAGDPGSGYADDVVVAAVGSGGGGADLATLSDTQVEDILHDAEGLVGGPV